LIVTHAKGETHDLSTIVVDRDHTDVIRMSRHGARGAEAAGADVGGGCIGVSEPVYR
jgi:hypothetical protein